MVVQLLGLVLEVQVVVDLLEYLVLAVLFCLCRMFSGMECGRERGGVNVMLVLCERCN